MRYLLFFIIFAPITNVNSQTILPSFSGVHNKKSDWLPSDMANSGWVDFSDSDNYSVSGSTLTNLIDKSGTYSFTINGNPLIYTGINSLNNLSVCFFDGSDHIISSDLQPQTDASGNHWAIGVFRADVVDNDKDSFWSMENENVLSSNKRDYAVSSNAVGSWPGELDLDNSSTTNRIYGTGAVGFDVEDNISLGEWVIVGVIFNMTGNKIQVRVDGEYAINITGYNYAINQDQKLNLMRNRGNRKLQGRVAEFFSVKDIPGTGGTDISDVEKAEGYLAHKWGLTGNLPVTHPYKSSAPSN